VFGFRPLGKDFFAKVSGRLKVFKTAYLYFKV